MYSLRETDISIHAPRGSDLIWRGRNRGVILFQSTLPRGATEAWALAGKAIRFQSTLPRGSDGFRDVIDAQNADFNPRSREGSDSILAITAFHFVEFQSTLPRGATLHSDFCPPSLFDFNPRSREGATDYEIDVTYYVNISIHAPAGSDSTQSGSFVRRINFNPRSREGASGTEQVCPGSNHFNPRSREERLRYRKMRLRYYKISIHAPAGSDGQPVPPMPEQISFQSTLPRGERLHLLTFFVYSTAIFYFISLINIASVFKKLN